MDEPTRRALTDLLDRRRQELVDLATDWVRSQAVDLGSRRPREETRALVERVVAAQATALLDDDERPLHELVELVTSLRAAQGFHVSTLLRGMLSFRDALEPLLRREIADGWVALSLLAALDRVANAAAMRAADAYEAKLHEGLLRRRAELEGELERMIQSHEVELDSLIRTVKEQRDLLNTLASPVLRVWKGVLVVPLIGEIDDARSEVIRERVLREVVVTRARAVLVDITGLRVTDANLASELLRLIACVRLIGAEVLLVGVSPEGARALAALQVRLDQVRSFATLGDGLVEALRSEGRRAARI